ncbi:MAG TPA: NADH-quinone oxidoreductase subunit M, partial [Verrucomicrobiota bacterium]|nr:NADH-quinone oxidoreductase subunit M [Verrucomicrobiota bacterium]
DSPGDAHGEPAGDAIEPISLPERAGAILLLGATLAIGLYPRLLLDFIVPSVTSLIQGLERGGGS